MNQLARQMEEAKAHLDSGDIPGARAAYEALAADAPHHLAGPLGLARVAAAEERWDESVAHWAGLFDRFPDRVIRHWQVGYGRSLIGAGQISAAIAMFQACLRDHPGDPAAMAPLARLLVSERRIEEARETVAPGGTLTSPSMGTGTGIGTIAAIHLARLRIFLWLCDTEPARTAHAAALELADNAADLNTLMHSVAQLYDGEERIAVWHALDAAIDSLDETADPEEAIARTMLRARVRLALRDHAGFLAVMDTAPAFPEPFAAHAAALAATLRSPAFPDYDAPRIFGIGLSKTGTTSLTAALQMLGYSTAHFRNFFSQALIAEDDLVLFDALTDTPISIQFERLYDMFPNALFIHTTRAFRDWIESFNRHTLHTQGSADFAELRERLANGQVSHKGQDFAANFRAMYLDHRDAGTAYHHYDVRVARFFGNKPRSKLLVHDLSAGDGWPSLCAFLGKPIPDQPYPWANRGVGAVSP